MDLYTIACKVIEANMISLKYKDIDKIAIKRYNVSMSTMNTLPAPRFEGQDHGTRGTNRLKIKKVSADHISDPKKQKYERAYLRAMQRIDLSDAEAQNDKKHNTFARADKAIESEEIAQGARDYRETPTTEAQITALALIEDYYDGLDESESFSSILDPEDIDYEEALLINDDFDHFDAEAALEDEAYEKNLALDLKVGVETEVTQEGTRRIRHRNAKRNLAKVSLGQSANG